MSATALERLQAMLDAAQARHMQPEPSVAPSQPSLDPRLHDYQRTAVRHLWDNPHAGLFLEMGLGKTAVTLQSLTPDHLPALVVAPKRVAERVWPVETPKWRPDLTYAIAAGTPAKRAAALASGADLVFIGRDNIKDIEPGRFRTIVLDELSGYKGRGTRWETARKICSAAPYVWGLTGTPSPNGYMDLWAQVNLLDGGKRLGRTLGSAEPRFMRPGSFRDRFYDVARVHRQTGVVIEWALKPGAKEQIEDLLSDICLSMRAIDHLDLPQVTVNEVSVPLDRKTSKVYDQMVEDLVAQMEDTTVAAANAAVATGKLSQITAGFLYPDVDDPDGPTTVLHSAKTDAITEMVTEIGSPVLLFYRFTFERDALLASLRKAGIDVRTIDEPGVEAAWDAGQVQVLLTHPASAGHGLNLQYGGHTIIWATMPWSLEEFDQGNGRIARQGQTHPVMIHQVISPDTVDEAIRDRLAGKTTVQQALMAALRRPV